MTTEQLMAAIDKLLATAVHNSILRTALTEEIVMLTLEWVRAGCVEQANGGR